ncbi:hypothetical protein HMN09_00174900 [Mycena chlorophos]|uniref:Uncharacterized protein n=1 Tax=Mycena chlorophos TaxID=658473 RepID=A0A8H6WN53_MYCCL|nr:hypothetical protein HMN09_00174900 [Mycena chlorophos]
MLAQSNHKPANPNPRFKRPEALNLPPTPSSVRSRSPSPGPSVYLRPSMDQPRAASPAASMYSVASSSTRSLQVPRAFSPRPLPSPPTLANLDTQWAGRSSSSLDRRSVDNSSDVTSSSPPDTPVDVVPDTELRRRQLSKAARVLGEHLPADILLKTKQKTKSKPNALLRVFPEPPPRRSTDSPVPGSRAATVRQPVKIARRASLSLATFASKLRGGGAHSHSRGSSQESQNSPSLSNSQGSLSSANSSPSPSPTAHAFAAHNQNRNTLNSPIQFAFPHRSQTDPLSGSWPRIQRPEIIIINPNPLPSPVPTLEFDSPVDTSLGFDPDQVIDIRASPEGGDFSDDDETYENYDDEPETPVVEFPTPRNSRRLHNYSSSEVLRPTPRIVPMPSHGHSPSEIVSPRSATPFGRPSTPFGGADPYTHVRPETPGADHAYSRPQTPFIDYVRPNTPYDDLDRPPARPTTPFTDLGHAETNAGDFLSPVVSRRRDQGWSGEWNQRDMAQVINKLRALR